MLKAAHGNLNPAHVVHCACIKGAFGQHIDAVFTSSGLGDLSTRCWRWRTRVNHDHARSFVEEFYDDSLLDCVPGRSHSAFPNYMHKRIISVPSEFGRHLNNLSCRLDRQVSSFAIYWKRLSNVNWQILGGGHVMTVIHLSIHPSMMDRDLNMSIYCNSNRPYIRMIYRIRSQFITTILLSSRHIVWKCQVTVILGLLIHVIYLLILQDV